MTACHPLLGVIGVMVHKDQSLLVRRSKEPDAGLWGFPGGHVELGETVAAGAVRELSEETGITATAGPFLDVIDVIRQDSTGQTCVHYALVAVRLDFISGRPIAGDDALEAAWVPITDIKLGLLPMSDGVAALIAKAQDSL